MPGRSARQKQTPRGAQGDQQTAALVQDSTSSTSVILKAAIDAEIAAAGGGASAISVRSNGDGTATLVAA